ncbi:hypothetical protein K9M79_02745 [Candidatus Woesearchaeota archaeon]|nr:hypothetical protein [Candidatus Woesearchaeota archaeon]
MKTKNQFKDSKVLRAVRKVEPISQLYHQRNRLILNNRKGVLEDFMMWVLRLIILIAVVSGIVTIVNYVFDENIDTHNLDYKILVDRTISCMSYYDYDTYREYTGILDPALMNEDKIKECIVSKSDLQGIGMIIKTPKGEFYFNKQFYEDYEPISWSKTYTKMEEKRYVLFKEADKLVPGTVEITAVIRVI